MVNNEERVEGGGSSDAQGWPRSSSWSTSLRRRSVASSRRCFSITIFYPRRNENSVRLPYSYVPFVVFGSHDERKIKLMV